MCCGTAVVVEDQPDLIQYDEISGGNSAKPHEFPWIVRIASGCAADSAADGRLGSESSLRQSFLNILLFPEVCVEGH